MAMNDLTRELGKDLGYKMQNFGQGKCVKCDKPFKTGERSDPEANIYTEPGLKETRITGLCEKCWDDIFADTEG